MWKWKLQGDLWKNEEEDGHEDGGGGWANGDERVAKSLHFESVSPPRHEYRRLQFALKIGSVFFKFSCIPWRTTVQLGWQREQGPGHCETLHHSSHLEAVSTIYISLSAIHIIHCHLSLMEIHRSEASILVLDHLHRPLLLLLPLPLLPLQVPPLQLLQPQPGQDKVHLDISLSLRSWQCRKNQHTRMK